MDIAFTPHADFGPRGPNWRTVFGETVMLPPGGAQKRDDLVGLAWHHILHARACIARRKPWQADYLIAAARHHVLALGCLRLGLPGMFAKGDDLLPHELTAPLEVSLVHSLEAPGLRRALAVVATALTAELERTDPALAAQLGPILAEHSR